MLNVIFSLDYEIHGNGDGDPLALMVEPTARMMDLFERYGARLTIMADVAEILKFKDHWERTGLDKFHYQAIARQLSEALRRGHDVQLHLHSSYFEAHYQNGRWSQEWSEYNFAGLRAERMEMMVGQGKQFLEQLLTPEKPDYRTEAFRAANWSVSPSRNVVRALLKHGIGIDSSVFKYGRREGLVNFDYASAESELEPWLVDESEICRKDELGQLVEVPIYCERRWIGAFVSMNRFRRVWMSKGHPIGHPGVASSRKNKVQKAWELLRRLFQRHPWKADFNQCTGGQLVNALRRALTKYGHSERALPFVLIGHSKLFDFANQASVLPFLKFVRDNPEWCRFGVYGDLDLPRPQSGKAGAASET